MRAERIWFFTCFLLCMMIFAGAKAEQGKVCVYRIRPQVERADTERADGTVFIGTARGKQKTAQLRIAPEGRSAEGNTEDLTRLLEECGGKVLHAFWRVEARETTKGTGRFLLWPEANRQKNITVNAAEGWNLWDLTEWMEPLLKSGEAFSFRLQSSSGAETDKAAFWIDRSWIYVTMLLERPDKRAEENRIVDSELLDIALSALPENHWMLKLYQEASGSLTGAQWPETGVPYYFGGHSEEKVLHRFFPLQESRYYKSSKLYLCGFDCGSFLHWVEEKTENLPHEDLSEILKKRAGSFPLTGMDLKEWNHALLPGDLLIFNHGTYHIGLVLGTLRMYGVSEQSAPELADWLDVPVMIHCGEDPFCYDRFRAYIEGQNWRMDTSPPDGGVTVSMLVPSLQDAPHVREAPWGKEYGYFEIMSQQMTVFPLDDCTELAWTRPQKR